MLSILNKIKRIAINHFQFKFTNLSLEKYCEPRISILNIIWKRIDFKLWNLGYLVDCFLSNVTLLTLFTGLQQSFLKANTHNCWSMSKTGYFYSQILCRRKKIKLNFDFLSWKISQLIIFSTFPGWFWSLGHVGLCRSAPHLCPSQSKKSAMYSNSS